MPASKWISFYSSTFRVSSSGRFPSRVCSGLTLLEVAIFLALSGILWTMAYPPMSQWWRGLRLELAAGEMAGELHLARSYAVRNHANVAVKFALEPDGAICQTLYRDNDGDGVRSRDIAEQVDTPVRPPHRIEGGVRFGFPPGDPPVDPSSGRRLDRLDDPIRFNQSDLASFSSEGTATPGTVYLTDGQFHLVAVRVGSRAGKISVLRYDPEGKRWR